MDGITLYCFLSLVSIVGTLLLININQLLKKIDRFEAKLYSSCKDNEKQYNILSKQLYGFSIRVENLEEFLDKMQEDVKDLQAGGAK